jgi:hypothetical protein
MDEGDDFRAGRGPDDDIGRPGSFGPDYYRDYGGRRFGFGDRMGGPEQAGFGRRDWESDFPTERRYGLQQGQHRGRGPKNYSRSDDRIREDACDRLTEDGFIDASDIDVQVAGAEVTLSGTVGSRDQRRRAEDCVEAVSGVRHVQNNLRVNLQGDWQAGATGSAMSPQRAQQPQSK